MSASALAQPPPAVHYRLVLPDGWVRLPADPVALRPAVRRWLSGRFAGLPRDATAQLRHELEQELVELADRGVGVRAVDLLLLTLDVADRPLSGSCLVSVLPVALSGPEQLAALAETARPDALSSDVVPLGSGSGVRVVRDERPDEPVAPLTGQDAERAAAVVRELVGPGAVTAPTQPPTSRAVDVFVPVPDAELTLLLSFSTPVRPLFDPLTDLFTAIAGTVQFRVDGQLWR